MQKTEVLPSAIEPSLLDLTDEEQREVNAIKEKANYRPIVLFMGRHVPHKGIWDLVETEKQIRNECIIYIAGSGPITEEVKNACTSNRIVFLGRLTDQEKKYYYHAADIFAFPSYTKAEGFGLTLCEAMYCHAVPVTYTIEGSGVNWVCLNGETGIEVPNRDVKTYAQAVDRLIENEELRKKMAEAGHRRVVENFVVKEEVALLKKQYKKLLK
jgi:glycosyltransferase involved in cell wall biosynthesis